MADFYEVRFTVRLPAEATPEEAESWLRFCLHDTNSMRVDNPLSRYEIEPVRGTFRAFPTAGTRGVPASQAPSTRAALWDAIAELVVACGGSAAHFDEAIADRIDAAARGVEEDGNG